MLFSRSRIFGMIFCLAITSGCGPTDGPFDYVPVSGKVTYEDGTPIPKSGLTIWFLPVDVQPIGDAHPGPASAEVNEQGEFDCATSHKYGDGLLPGTHKVAISGAKQEKELLVPKEYLEFRDTPLTINTDDLPLVIKIPRP